MLIPKPDAGPVPLIALLFALFSISHLIAQTSDYLPGALYIQYEKHHPHALGKLADPSLQVVSQTPILPARFRKRLAKRTGESAPITRIYRVALADRTGDMEQAARKLADQPGVAWAEPVWDHHLFLRPNDPLFGDGSQQYLDLINAPAAWDVSTGSDTVVVAIIDTGILLDHPDLVNKIWFNPGETGIDDDGNDKARNGIDDDGNGLVDDYTGWDFFDDDNDPNPGPTSNHGTHVTGIAAAESNNSTGVASLGYNTSFYPIKVSPDDGSSLRFGYEAMLYAAALGVDVINASWGSPRFSRTGREVVRTVTESGTLIVAAAGNDNDDQIIYPAGYPEVISVAAGNLSSEKADFSSFGSFVDVSAPGDEIFSTLATDPSYGLSSGTSMASPLVAAQAALIRAANPAFDIDQIRAQIVATTTPMNISSGAAYTEFELGSGLIDASSAVGDAVYDLEIFRAAFHDSTSNNNDIFERGEVIAVDLIFKNYGLGANDVTVQLTPLDPEVLQFEDGSSSSTLTTGSVAHSEKLARRRVRLLVTPKAEIDQKVQLRLTYNYPDGTSTSEVVSTNVLPSLVAFRANTIAFSVDGEGHIGFANYPEFTKGIPFVIQQNTTQREQFLGIGLLLEGGLLFGSASENRDGSFAISSSIRSGNPSQADQDFAVREPITQEQIDEAGSLKSTVVFTDIDAGTESYNVIVRNETFAFNEVGHEQYALFAYDFENRDGSRDYNEFRAGLFYDFNLPFGEAENDTAYYDAERDLLVMQSSPDGVDGDTLFIGATVIGGIGTPWIIENGANGSIDFGIDNGFTEEEKWQALSGGIRSETAPSMVNGPGDLSFVISPPALNLPRGSRERVIFAVGYGFTRAELFTQIENARQRSSERIVSIEEPVAPNNTPTGFAITGIYPNPFNPTTTIQFSVEQPQRVDIELFDITGRAIRTITSGRFTSGSHAVRLDGSRLSSGVYLVRISGQDGSRAYRKVTLVK